MTSLKSALAATALGFGLAAAGGGLYPIGQAGAQPRKERAQPQQQQPSPQEVRQGATQQGEASYYGPGFSGKTMADGDKFDPNSDSAASKTLPLGTVAKVENLENGRTTTVKVKDRGPYVRNRVLDVSAGSAAKLDMKKEGTAPVKITPIEVPDHDVKPGHERRQRTERQQRAERKRGAEKPRAESQQAER